MYKLLFALLLSLAFIQCKKEEATELDLKDTLLFYAQTGCADPWGSQQADEEIIAAVTMYLEENIPESFDNIEVTFDPDHAMACLACQCTTGKLIQLTALKDKLEDYLALGFQTP